MVTEIRASDAAERGVRDDLGSRYLRASLDSILRGGSSMIISGFVPMILARFLGPHDFGIYTILTALTAVVVSLLHLGQNSPLHKLLPEYATTDPARAGAILANLVLLTFGLVSIFCVCFLLGAQFVAQNIYRDASLTPFFRLCAVLIFITTILNLASSVAAGLQEFKAYNSTLLIRSSALLILAVLGVAVWGLWGALASQVVAGVLGLLWLLPRLAKLITARFSGLIRPRRTRETWQQIATFMLPAFVMILLNTPSFWWANTLTAREQGFAQAGFFSVAYAMVQLIAMAPYNFYIPALTFLSEAQASANRADFNQLVLRSLRGLWLLLLPLALGCALFSPLIIHLFFGAKYQAALPAAFLMCLAALFMCVVGLLNAVIAAAGRIWQGCCITFIWALIFFATGLLAIPRWGAMGAALTFTLSYVVYLLLQCGYFQFALAIDLRPMWQPWALTLVSYLAATLLVYKFHGLPLYLAGGLLLVTTIIGIFLIRDETERKVCELSFARVKQFVWS
ncbi:MAG TPA: oligosaccharide flippase family protein [Blastocatellia bacterium]|nr:oligosaccharide flippase family protein [Blastocatellia bacterium]